MPARKLNSTGLSGRSCVDAGRVGAGRAIAPRAPRLIEPPTFSAFGCAYNAPSPAAPSQSVATATQVQPAFARIMPSSPNLRLMQDCQRRWYFNAEHQVTHRIHAHVAYWPD